MAGRTFALRFLRIFYWLLVPVAFCSSFFIYLPGPTLPLASLHRPVTVPASIGAESKQTPRADDIWHYGENSKELVMMPQQPYKAPEWPYTVGRLGWVLGILLTPVVLLIVARLSGSGLWAALRRQPLPQVLLRGMLCWGSLPLALVVGVWFGIEVVIPWSYRYSARRAQPLIAALRQRAREHPAATASLPPLVPRYLPMLPTPGTLGSGYFEYGESWPPNPAFGYPHAPGIFPAYRIEYVPGPFRYTNDTQSAGFPNWQVRRAW